MQQERYKMSKLLLIDGHSILNRAYYGLPDLTNAAGLHTNAVYGFLNMMFKFIDSEKPTHFAVAFDVHEPTFRHKMYDAYKGTRKPMDPELRQQVPMIQEMLRAMDVPVVTCPGFEADDILGTLAKEAEKAGAEVTIVSGDRDLLQLASDKIKISIPKTKKGGTEIENYFASDVLEQKEVTPEEFIDVKALWGDTADNIPGVPSIGEKTATAIIKEYHTVENAYEHRSELKPGPAKKLEEFYDQAILSKKLATIDVNADISFNVDQAILENVNDLYTDEAYKLCKEWEFKNLLSRFENTDTSSDLEEYFKKVSTKKEADDIFSKMKGAIGFFIVDSDEPASESDGQLVLFDMGPSPFKGIAVSSGSEAYYLPNEGELSKEYLLGKLEELAAGDNILSTRELKKALHHINIESYDNAYDTSVAAYLINPLLNEYGMDDIAKDYLHIMVPSYIDILGKLSIADAASKEPEKLSTYACYEAYIAAKAVEKLNEELIATGMDKLYSKIELPLVFTLTDMEKEGMALNKEELILFGKELSVRIVELEKSIYDKAGEEFNINSPKQLGEILFGKLGLPNGKKTKTGYSTAADVLEGLAFEYPIVADILEYRQLAKLKSTYVEGLVAALSPDGRIHSTFQQTVTATGRISSTDPNLQNIPIRLELGKLIRKVFYPREGYTYVDADYSQIELRVLAHLSQDENLLTAYKNGQDIHRSTASLVFHTPFEEVTSTQRSNAKAVNFGIVYGISAFGLAKDLGISRKEAQEYIDNYFIAYPTLHEYLNNLVTEAKEKGYTETLFGRRRPIPELASSNFMQRSFGERVAMNAPIQGTAADIIKAAMVNVHDRLKAEGLESKLVLQVHDELLIEAKNEELSQVFKIMQEEMQGAANLAISLDIDIHEGKTWYDAK